MPARSSSPLSWQRVHGSAVVPSWWQERHPRIEVTVTVPWASSVAWQSVQSASVCSAWRKGTVSPSATKTVSPEEGRGRSWAVVPGGAAAHAARSEATASATVDPDEGAGRLPPLP